ncbi:MAG: sugar kinase, partial [Rhodospirillaceae bacterium]|nr:sugar kinase [Rhodospirillaceae bacterium]
MVELSPDMQAGAKNCTLNFGGDTLNTAVYLARLGQSVSYVTVLSDDPFSDTMIDAWAREGIDTTMTTRLPGRLPGLYAITTDATGERSFHYWRDK